jgi:hypothetical protein
MTDHQLSTRDLAGRPDDEEGTVEPEPTDTAVDTSSTGQSGADGEPAENGDASASRDAADGEQESPVAEREPLLPSDQSERFTSHWHEIQTSFVDRPRDAVAEADALVADLMQRLAASFSKERERLEAQWDQGDDVSTEELRVALTRYRSFFDRLLSA